MLSKGAVVMGELVYQNWDLDGVEKSCDFCCRMSV